MWESHLSGSVRGMRTTGVWKTYCGTVAKAGGNGENKLLLSSGRLMLLKAAGIVLAAQRPVRSTVGPTGESEGPSRGGAGKTAGRLEAGKRTA